VIKRTWYHQTTVKWNPWECKCYASTVTPASDGIHEVKSLRYMN
jgi:hypothetical protein